MKKITPIFVLLISFVIIPYQIKGEENKFVLGFSSGYSFGLVDAYRVHEEGYIYKYKWQHKKDFRSGVNFQYYFSHNWAIQGEIAYQRDTYHKWGQDYDGTFFDYTEDESYIAPYLNLIYELRRDKISPYITVGLGKESDLPYFFIIFMKTGLGMRYFFSSKIGLNSGVFFYIPFFVRGSLELLNPSINYLSLNIGLEYSF